MQEEEQCQNDTVQFYFYFFIFFYGDPKNGLQQMPPLYNAYGAGFLRSKFYKDKQN